MPVETTSGVHYLRSVEVESIMVDESRAREEAMVRNFGHLTVAQKLNLEIVDRPEDFAELAGGQKI